MARILLFAAFAIAVASGFVPAVRTYTDPGCRSPDKPTLDVYAPGACNLNGTSYGIERARCSSLDPPDCDRAYATICHHPDAECAAAPTCQYAPENACLPNPHTGGGVRIIMLRT